MARLPRRIKQGLLVAFDFLTAPLCVWLGVAVRLGDVFPQSEALLPTMAFAAVAAPIVFAILGLYREITRYVGGKYLARHAVGALVVASALGAGLYLLPGSGFPRTALVVFAMSLWMVGVGGRLLARRVLLGNAGRSARVAIYGAGDAGAGLAMVLAQDRHSRVVAMFDDGADQVGTVVAGIRVHSGSQLERVVREQRIGTLLLAIDARHREGIKSAFTRATALDLRVLRVPTLKEMGEGRVRVDELRPIALSDLLGRQIVPPDENLLREQVTGRRVLVTGGGGSIGSELCRQVMALGPTHLVVVDNSEFNLFNIEAELRERASAPGSAVVEVTAYLASVTDAARMDQILLRHAPDIVFHAAAYKHVHIVEANEAEGAAVNVLGTRNVAQSSRAAGVRKFVLISTDKAVRPAGVMGATKRLAEQVVQSMQDAHGEEGPTSFSMVRFGNVLGSSGSVVPVFERQIRAGGPVTVTHPEIARYFMTIPEAVQLVLQAAAMSVGGEVFVLDMGEPVRIADLARNMIRLAGMRVRDDQEPDGDIEIAYTGLRPGEKLVEELVIGEDLQRTSHPGILTAHEAHMGIAAAEEAVARIEQAVDQCNGGAVRRVLESAVAGYRPPPLPR